MHRPVSIPRTSRIALLAAFTGAVLVVAACGDMSVSRSESADGVSPNSPAPLASQTRVGFAGGAEAKRMAVASDAANVAAPAPAAEPDQEIPRVNDSATAAMIIRNGFVSIQVDSLDVAIATIRSMAGRLGGYIGNVQTTTGEYQVRNSTIEVKVPSARFDEAMSGLTPIGKIESSSATAEDVGEEFTDTKARMDNARRLEERLVTLLATRTGKLEDVLTVERELARVREQIERYEGRLRFLRSRVSMSTLSISVHEVAPLVNPNPGTNVLVEAFKSAWRNFVSLLAASIASLGILVPVGVIAGVVVWVVRKVNRPPASAA